MPVTDNWLCLSVARFRMPNVEIAQIIIWKVVFSSENVTNFRRELEGLV